MDLSQVLFTINSDHTKDSINELNFILGKLVPIHQIQFNVAVDLTNDTEHFLCAGFTPTNNTGGVAPDQTGTTSYVRNTTSQVTTDPLKFGPGGSRNRHRVYKCSWCREQPLYQHQIMMEPMIN